MPQRAMKLPAMRCLILSCLAILLGAAEIRVADHGAKGDGIADDGAALEQALAALAMAPRPAVLRFAPKATYRIATGSGHVINLLTQEHVTIEGAGALLLLGGDRRGVAVDGCRDVTVRGLRIDYDPLPFAEALVTAVDRDAHRITVRVAEGFSLPPAGGPTRAGGEQTYFAMLWNPGPFALRSLHYVLADLQPAAAGGRMMDAVADPGFHDFAAITPGTTRITLPVRGIAHRHGAGAVLVIDRSRDVVFEDIEVWSAPWFACIVQRNEGTVTLRHVNVRPRPGTVRITSSWRDGMHVKGNRATLLFEDCVLDGMNDDSFNLATYLSHIEAVDGVTLRIRQNFPLGHVAWRGGDTLMAYGVKDATMLGRARVVAVEEKVHAKPDWAPTVTLTLDRALPGLARDDQVWAVEAANPGAVVRRCTMRNSCRFQTAVTLEDCDAAAFLWFYGESIEGPVPSGSMVRNCRLRVGRGNAELAVACDGWLHGPKPPPAMSGAPPLAGLHFEDNDIDGRLEIRHAQQVRLTGNRFTPQRGRLTIHDCREVVVEGTRLGDAPFPADRLRIEGAGTREQVVVR